jgi:hypothetical protein
MYTDTFRFFDNTIGQMYDEFPDAIPNADNTIRKYGNVVAFMRDYATGRTAYITIPTERVIKSIGKRGYYYNIIDGETVPENPVHRLSVKRTFIECDLPSNLKFGDIGFVENKAFTLLTYKDEHGEFVNIYKRKYPESVKEIIVNDIVAISDKTKNIISFEGDTIQTIGYEM